MVILHKLCVVYDNRLKCFSALRSLAYKSYNVIPSGYHAIDLRVGWVPEPESLGWGITLRRGNLGRVIGTLGPNDIKR